MKYIIKLLPIFTAAMLLSGCAEEVAETVPETVHVDETADDGGFGEISAAEDFYGYVDLHKLDSLEIGYNKSSAGYLDEVSDSVDKSVRELILSIANSTDTYPRGSGEQIVRDYFRQLMEFDGCGDSSEGFFDDYFGRIDSVTTAAEFMDVCADLYRETGVSLFFDLRCDSDQYGSGNDVLYQTVANSVLNRVSMEYIGSENSAAMGAAEYIGEVLRQLGTDKDEAKSRGKEAVYLLISIAGNVEWETRERPDFMTAFKPYTIAEAEELFTNIDFGRYIKRCGGASADRVYFYDEKEMRGINDVLTDENITALRDIAKCTFIAKYGEMLPDRHKSLRNKMFYVNDSYKEDTAVDRICCELEDIVGGLYAKYCCDKSTAEAAEELCEEMRDSYRDLISGADWLSAEGRAQCLDKLEKMVFVIGEGEPGGTAYANAIGETLLETVVNINAADGAAVFAALGKPHNRQVMEMTPQTVNACYSPTNTMYIPYGILNKPIFDPDRSEARNLGQIGSIIAHEMSHAFDPNNIVFDGEGKYSPERISDADRIAFEQRMDKVRDYYSGFRIIDVYNIDGELTLGENFADLGSMECIMSIVKTPDEKRELLESYAELWCTLSLTRDAVRALRYDCHSPAQVRVNAVISSCDDFYELYDVKEGDGMYVPKEERVSRW